MGHIHVPLNGFHFQRPDSVDGLIVVIPIGQPDQRGAHPGDRFDFVVAGRQIGSDFLRGELRIVGTVAVTIPFETVAVSPVSIV